MRLFIVFLVLMMSVPCHALTVSQPSSSSGSSTLTNGQVQATNVANDSIGPEQTTPQMLYSTSTVLTTVTIPANTGMWFRLFAMSTSAFVSSTIEAGYGEPGNGGAARVRFLVGRWASGGGGTTPRTAVLWAHQTFVTNGFGAVGVDSTGNAYVQITNKSHNALSVGLQAAAWCEGNPDMIPVPWTITTQSIVAVNGDILYITPSTNVTLRYPRGHFNQLYADELTVSSNSITIGSTTLSDSGGIFAISSGMLVGGDQTILGNGFIGVGMTNPPSALTVDGDIWTTNGWMMAHLGAKNRTNELTWTNGLRLNNVEIGAGGGGAYVQTGTNNIAPTNANGNTIGSAVKDSVISGGGSNVINSLVTGGETPRNNGILAGRNNVITNGAYGPVNSAIGAGWNNVIGTGAGDPSYSFIGSGIGNKIFNQALFIGGGNANTGGVSATYAGIVAGYNNGINANYTFIGAGEGNNILATHGGIVAGQLNDIGASATHAFIGGGYDNDIGASATYATVGGGKNNDISGVYGTIAGGQENTDVGTYNFTGGGDNNNNGGAYNVINGGQNNTIASGTRYTLVIGGGNGNSFGASSGSGGVIGGGQFNSVEGEASVLGGGLNNIITNNSYYSVIPGGEENRLVGAPYSFAAGRYARGLHNGVFVWADNQGANTFSSTATNQVLIRASGGVRIAQFGGGQDTNTWAVTGMRIVTNANVFLHTPAWQGSQLLDVGSNRIYYAVGLTTNDWKGTNLN